MVLIFPQYFEDTIPLFSRLCCCCWDVKYQFSWAFSVDNLSLLSVFGNCTDCGFFDSKIHSFLFFLVVLEESWQFGLNFQVPNQFSSAWAHPMGIIGNWLEERRNKNISPLSTWVTFPSTATSLWWPNWFNRTPYFTPPSLAVAKKFLGWVTIPWFTYQHLLHTSYSHFKHCELCFLLLDHQWYSVLDFIMMSLGLNLFLIIILKTCFIHLVFHIFLSFGKGPLLLEILSFSLYFLIPN